MATVKIVFLLLPRVHLLDLAGAEQVFHEAIGFGANMELEYCGLAGKTETTTNLPFGKLTHFSKIKMNAGDYLFIPGAEVDFLLSEKMVSEKKLIDWVKEMYTKGVNICSICTGAFFLATAGLLTGKKCTTHWKRTAELKQHFPLIQLQENILFTEDNRIFTSAGVTSGIDMALHILSSLMDDNFSYKVARELVVYIRRQGNEPQQSLFMNYRNHIHSGIHTVQDYLQVNLHKKTTLDTLADVACMSPRSLTRIFKKETGISVNGYVTLVRKERLTELIKNPDITRKAMAKYCGLASERQVIRLLKQF